MAFPRKHRGQPFYLNLWIKETHLAHEPSEASLRANAHLGEQQRVYSAVVMDSPSRSCNRNALVASI